MGLSGPADDDAVNGGNGGGCGACVCASASAGDGGMIGVEEYGGGGKEASSPLSRSTIVLPISPFFLSFTTDQAHKPLRLFACPYSVHRKNVSLTEPSRVCTSSSVSIFPFQTTG